MLCPNSRANQPFQASDFFELNWKAVGALELNSMFAVSRSALGAFLVIMMLSPGRCRVAVNNCINEAFDVLYFIKAVTCDHGTDQKAMQALLDRRGLRILQRKFHLHTLRSLVGPRNLFHSRSQSTVRNLGDTHLGRRHETLSRSGCGMRRPPDTAHIL